MTSASVVTAHRDGHTLELCIDTKGAGLQATLRCPHTDTDFFDVPFDKLPACHRSYTNGVPNTDWSGCLLQSWADNTDIIGDLLVTDTAFPIERLPICVEWWCEDDLEPPRLRPYTPGLVKDVRRLTGDRFTLQALLGAAFLTNAAGDLADAVRAHAVSTPHAHGRVDRRHLAKNYAHLMQALGATDYFTTDEDEVELAMSILSDPLTQIVRPQVYQPHLADLRKGFYDETSRDLTEEELNTRFTAPDKENNGGE